MYHLAHTIRTSLGGEKDLKSAEDRFVEARQKLLAEGGGIVSTVYHPCEFVHKQFWDGVNFTKGENPPREQWKLPPAKSEAESKTAYETFQAYVTFMKRFPDVQFITASEAAEIYKDRAAGRSFTKAEIKSIASGVGEKINYQTHDDYTLAPSEIFALLNSFLVDRTSGRKAQAMVLKVTPIGPTGTAPAMADSVSTDASQFRRTAADVEDFLAKQGRVPSAVWVGSAAVTPEAYLVTLSHTVLDLIDGKSLPERIELKPCIMATAKCVADDAPNLWGWVIFPPGFRAPAMMELAKRQAWTIKPAINHGR